MRQLPSQNSIQKAEVNIYLESIQKDVHSGEELVGWVNSNVLEAIDHHTENLVAREEMVKIPILELSINLNEEKDLFNNDSGIRAQIWDQVYSSLRKAIREKTIPTISLKTYYANIVLNYLSTGQVNEFYSQERWDELISHFLITLTKEQILQSEFLRIIQKKEGFVRFYRLNGAEPVNNLLNYLTKDPDFSRKLKSIQKLLNTYSKHFIRLKKIDLYHRVFQQLGQGVVRLKPMLPVLIKGVSRTKSKTLNKIETTPEMRSVWYEVQQAINEDTLQLPVNTDRGDKELSATEELEEGAYVGQAGLVLLAPFLPAFLKNTGFLDSKGKLKKKRRIPILLHYVATGETNAPEWKLTLPKILAGMRPGEFCSTKIKPSKELNNQIQEFLKSVIAHWEALQNTSPDGLRGTFLIREGILKFKNGYHYLYIDEHTVDILLNYVSWNYTTIRLDWMQRILFVEWTKS